MTAGKVIKRILIIAGICIVLLVLGTLWYLPTLMNNRITSYVNEHTEFSLTISGISFAGHHSLEIRGLKFRHKADRDTHIKQKGYETDWIDSKASVIFIYGIDWNDLLWNNRFYADRILIVSPDIYVFRDKRMPNDYINKALPAALLRNATSTFTIPIVEIRNGKVVYEEVTRKTKRNISIPFTHLYASFYHISSDSDYLSQQPLMTIDAQAMIFDSVRTSVIYKANTLDPSNTFTLEGNMKAFSARLLNRGITPASNVVIEDGFVNHIYFKFVANENEANGTMNMDHKNLRLAVLKKDTTTGIETPKKSRLKSILANLFVRNKDKTISSEKEPANGPEIHSYTGRIHFVRRKDRFIFNYWWNCFKSGVVSTVAKVPADRTHSLTH